jgi:hypothetical protein
MSAPCGACRAGACEDCQRLGLACDCCAPLDDLAEHHDELEFASLHEEGLA